MSAVPETITRQTNLWRYRDLVLNLVAKDIKVRYMGAVLGFAWSLANPLIVTLTYVVVFTYIFPTSEPNYALFLVTGIIHWTLFTQVINQSCEILVINGGLIRKIYFPRILVPLSNLIVNVILWLSALAVFLIVFPFIGGQFTLALLVYPFYLCLFIGFIFGLSLILSILYVDFRDLKHLVEVALQVLFWATPILYPIKVVPPDFRWIDAISPLTEFTLIFQSFFYAHHLPTAHLTGAFALWTIGSLICGLWLFNRRMPALAERL
jgi:lipopolysaccharide transport system permease protein